MMQFKIKTLIALTALTTLASCSMMSDDFDDCPQGLSVQFVYDYNVERADMFNDHVGSVRYAALPRRQRTIAPLPNLCATLTTA